MTPSAVTTRRLSVVKARDEKYAHRRLRNKDKRTREYLTKAEVERMITAARSNGRYGDRDAIAIMLAYRHGLRVKELINLRWQQVDFDRAVMHVVRVKQGDPSVQPLSGDELRALGKLKRNQPNGTAFVFMTSRRGPMSERAFHKIVQSAGEAAKLNISVHPHMLRHACGYQLANAGMDTRFIQAYLGHRNIQHTVLYTQLNEHRFKDAVKVL